MNTMANILNIEMPDINPLGSGKHYLPRNFPILDARDGSIYQVYGSGSATQPPRVVNRRFFSGSRSARTVSIHFSDDFCLHILDSLWGTDHKETIGNDNEWYCLSLRLSGDTLESVCDQDYRLGAYSGYLVRYARGMIHILRSVSEQPLIEACMMFRPAMLAEKLSLSRGELARLLHPGGDLANPWFRVPRWGSVNPSPLGDGKVG